MSKSEKDLAVELSAQTLQQIARLKEVYGMDYGLEASHHLKESSSSQKEGESDAL